MAGQWNDQRNANGNRATTDHGPSGHATRGMRGKRYTRDQRDGQARVTDDARRASTSARRAQWTTRRKSAAVSVSKGGRRTARHCKESKCLRGTTGAARHVRAAWSFRGRIRRPARWQLRPAAPYQGAHDRGPGRRMPTRTRARPSQRRPGKTRGPAAGRAWRQREAATAHPWKRRAATRSAPGRGAAPGAHRGAG